MKLLYTLLLILLSCSFIGCEKEVAHQPQLPLQESMTGNWLVVYQKLKSTNFIFEDRHEGVVTKWGCHYILSLKINSDGTYAINSSDTSATTKQEPQPQGGQWWLDDQNKLTFSCEPDMFQTYEIVCRVAAKLHGTAKS